ncbi:MAG: asparagine synthase (glutamine-hydrolyzing) [Candidatus Binatia bacterium]
MCGIAGILKLDPRARVEEDRLRRMCDAIRHRGPDDAGLWIDGPIGLGHRRLSIVDVAAGHQPMRNQDGRVWITFNGEIYNHPDLQPRFEAAGHRYRTRCDTETILHAYEEAADACVERLDGMFAFALWDGARRRLLLARDRLGIKPLYYAITPTEVLFGSEIKAILAAGGIRPELNRDIVPEFLANRFVAGDETFFRGIRKLLPGRTLSWSAPKGFEDRRYWQVPRATTEQPVGSLQQCAMDLRERLKAAVQSHLMSDVPLGLFLSGGLDSSGLAALMAALVDRPIRTFAVGFSDPAANELSFARLAARSIRSHHSEIVVSPEEFFRTLPSLIWHEDEPIAFTSSVPLYFVSRLAEDHVKVVLTGEGADELFLGYNWYPVTAWNVAFGRVYGTLAPHVLREGIRRLTERLPSRLGRYARRTFLALEPDIRGLRYENFAVFPVGMQKELLCDPNLLVARDPHGVALRLFDEALGGTLERLSYVDLQTYLVELLMKQDQMSMAASIESRVPFLDHHLVEHVATIPARFKVSRGRTKLVLRKALDGLVPPEILTRRKMGFPVPISNWLRSAFSPIVDEFVLSERTARRGLLAGDALRRLVERHRRGVEDHGDRLWLLVNLEIWHRMFIDGESARDVLRDLKDKCALAA